MRNDNVITEAASVSEILADDQSVMSAVHHLVGRLSKKSFYLAEHSLATSIAAAVVAKGLGLDADLIFSAAVVGALHEVAALAFENPSEMRAPQSGHVLWLSARNQFRVAALAMVNGIECLRPYASMVAELYTANITSRVAQIVVVADWYDWLASEGDGQRVPLSSQDALHYLEDNVGRFRPDVVLALRELCLGSTLTTRQLG